MANSSSLNLHFTSFLPSPRPLFSSYPAFSLRLRKLPLHGNPHFLPPPISSSSSSSSTSSQIRKPSTSNPSQSRSKSSRFDFRGEISRLRLLQSRILEAGTLEEKDRVLDSDSRVRDFARERKRRVLDSLGPWEAFLIKCLVAAGQEHVLAEVEVAEVSTSGLRRALHVLGDMVENWSLNGNGVARDGGCGFDLGCGVREELESLLKTLGEMEKFYDCIGGILG